MRLFDPRPNCPKCTSETTKFKYIYEQWVRHNVQGQGSVGASVDYIEVTCQSCAYDWMMHCADKQMVLKGTEVIQ